MANKYRPVRLVFVTGSWTTAFAASIGKAIESKGKTVEIGKASQAVMGKRREMDATPGRTSQGDMAPHRVAPSISRPAVREHTDFTQGFPARLA